MLDGKLFDMEVVRCCPLCGGEGIYSRDGSKYGNSIKVDKCQECGVEYQNPRLTRPAVEDYYASNLNNNCYRSPYINEIARAKHIINIMRGFDIIPTRCLDVGCGRGVLLGSIKEKYGSEVLGLDSAFADDAVIDETVYSKEEVQGKFDLILCIHTLEHLYNPQEELLWMKSLLSIGGTIIVETPYEEKVYQPHIFIFNRMSIRLMLERVGIDYIGLDMVKSELFLLGPQYRDMKVESIVDIINASTMNNGIYR